MYNRVGMVLVQNDGQAVIQHVLAIWDGNSRVISSKFLHQRDPIWKDRGCICSVDFRCQFVMVNITAGEG